MHIVTDKDRQADRQTDRRSDGRQDDADSRSDHTVCVAVRSAKSSYY